MERDEPEAVIAAYLMAAPEQGDWSWAAHCDGMAGGLIDALEAHGYSLHGPEDRTVLDLARKHHPDRCPRSYGHWYPYANQTEADRPERYADPRTRRIDCSDDQCRNPDCVRYVRCENRWHDMDEALRAARRARGEQP